MPITEFRRQIPPRTAGAQKVEDRFEELAIRHLAGRAGLRMFGRANRGFKLLPDLIGDAFAHGMFEHPKFQSAPRTFVHIIIREHCLILGLATTAVTFPPSGGFVDRRRGAMLLALNTIHVVALIAH